MKKVKYVVCDATGATGLTKIVTDKLNNGYELYGSLCVCYDGSFRRYSQAVVKYSNNEEKV